MFKWLGLHMLSKLFEPLEEILETYWSVRRDFQRNQIFTSSQRLSACHNYKLWPLFSSYMKYLDVSYCYKDLGGWPCCQVVKFLFHFGGLGLGSIWIATFFPSRWIRGHFVRPICADDTLSRVTQQTIISEPTSITLSWGKTLVWESGDPRKSKRNYTWFRSLLPQNSPVYTKHTVRCFVIMVAQR